MSCSNRLYLIKKASEDEEYSITVDLSKLSKEEDLAFMIAFAEANSEHKYFSDVTENSFSYVTYNIQYSIKGGVLTFLGDTFDIFKEYCGLSFNEYKRLAYDFLPNEVH